MAAPSLQVVIGDALVDLPLVIKLAQDVQAAIASLPPKATRKVSDDEKLAAAILTAAEPLTDALEEQLHPTAPTP